MRKYGSLYVRRGDRAACEGSGAQCRVWLQRYTDVAQPGLRVDHGAKQAHPARERLRQPRQVHGCVLTYLERTEILLGDLPAHLDLAAARKTEEGVSTRTCGLTDFGFTRQNRAALGSDDTGAIQPRLRLSELRGGNLDSRFVGERSRTAFLDVFRG